MAQQASNRRLDIQGLRAVAVLFVVVFHAGLPFPGGFVGVDVFFVISGFVIASLLSREWGATGRLRFRTFYARRFRRLAPALALTVSVTVLVSSVVQSPLAGQETTAKTGLGATLLVANNVIARNTGGYFDAAAQTNPLLHTWSLSVEEQFYLVFPLVLLLGWWLSRHSTLPRAGAFLTTLVVGLGSFALAVLSSRGYQVPHAVFLGFYSPITRAWEFAAGALLALAALRVPALDRRVAGLLGLVGLALLALSLRVITQATPFPGPATLLPVTGSLLVIAAGLSSDNLASRGLASRPFVAIGDLSYSWYLWHWPLIVFAGIVWPASKTASIGAAALSLAPAWASYRWVEQPIRRLRNVPPRRMAAIAACTLLPPIVLATSLRIAVDNGFWSPRVRTLEAAVVPLHAAAVAGCTAGDTQLTSPNCLWNTGATGPQLYLVGDSNADQFSEAVIGAGRLLDRPVWISTFNGCSFLGASWSNETDAFKARCRAYVDGTVGALQGVKPGVVVIAFSDSLWTERSAGAGPTRATETTDPRAKARYLQADLRSIVARLRAAGHEVLLMQPLPKPQRIHGDEVDVLFDPSKCSTFSVLRSGCPKPVETSRAYEDRLQADPRATITRVAASTGAQVLDLRDHFCSATVCSTHRGSLPLYRDGGHISVATSDGLARTFADAIR